jgi:NADH-quinone oxidoreductase subunit L
MLIGCCALSGFPFFSGFFSKDEIVGAAWAHHRVIAIVLLFTAFLTAYYTFRLYFRVFEGPEIIPPEPEGTSHIIVEKDADEHLQTSAHQAATADDHGEHAHHNHEPAIMIVPLIVLAVGALLVGYFNFPKEHLGRFLGHSPSLIGAAEVAERGRLEFKPAVLGQEEAPEAHDAETESGGTMMLMVLSGLISAAGIGLAYQFHLKNRAAGDALPRRFPVASMILENKYWVDEIYDAVIVRPLWRVGQVFYAIDRIVIEGIVWMVGFIPQLFGFTLKLTTQRGYLQGYASAMAFGILVILLIVFW